MINKTEIQVNGLIAELRVQRDQLGDRAANLAAELACEKAEKAVLQGRIESLEEELKKATGNHADEAAN
jgi:transcription elongation GreA/GreB family factor